MGSISSTSANSDPDCMKYEPDNTLRIVLVGKTGNGKSETGNSIIGDQSFVAGISSESVTKKCEKKFKKRESGKDLLVVDTPGLFDTKESLETTCNEISRCVILSCPGPHAIILVLRLGRFTDEEKQSVCRIKALFGPSITKYMVIVFTGKDDLGDQTLDEFLKNSNVNLKNLLKECNKRYCAFNNRAEGSEKKAQVKELLDMIEKMEWDNKGAHFSDAIYEKTEERLKKRREALKAIYIEQLKNDISEIQQKYDQIQHPTEKDTEEKECKIRELKQKYEENIQNLRTEVEKEAKILAYVAEYIKNLISKISCWF